MTYWNSELYLRFLDERTRPAVELLSAVSLNSPKHIIDIGCGPGNSTAVLSERFPESEIIGVDNSAEMIDKARLLHPELTFCLRDVSGDLSKYTDSFDLVFSNACIQWLPDHKTLLPRLMSLVTDGGILAVQVPVNYNEPVHRIIRETATSEKWRNKFSIHRDIPVLSSSKYFNILSQISTDFRIWKTVYYHRMLNHSAILDWVRATGLRPYLLQLNEDDSRAFECDILTKLNEEYTIEPCGEILFPFPRLFFTAVK